ncbi:trimeric intracellular cation channel family protein [Rubritalea tangerina]|uniref:trimeric intracellular cation channel family protein n=1 Tax=Rubritalea tangerina TaxID=430798 RepID=UPI003612DF62
MFAGPIRSIKRDKAVIYLWDIIGTFIFCVSGAIAGRQLDMDYLGVFVMALITGTGGGLLRSILLGDVPPVIFTTPDYVIVAVLAVPVAVLFGKWWESYSRIVSIVDALGIGLFACVGARAAAAHGLDWWACMGMGMVSATFGGVIRDVIRNEVPLIFRREIYATAALLGAGCMLLMDELGVEPSVSLVGSALMAAVVRLLAIRYAINASKA